MTSPFFLISAAREGPFQDLSQKPEVQCHDGAGDSETENVPELPHNEDSSNGTNDEDDDVDPLYVT